MKMNRMIIVKSAQDVIHVVEMPEDDECYCNGQRIGNIGHAEWTWLDWIVKGYEHQLVEDGKRLCKHCARRLRRLIAYAERALSLYEEAAQ